MSRQKSYTPVEKTCKHCNETFLADTKYKFDKQQFCDHTCRANYWGIKREQKTKKIERECKWCGELFKIAPCYKDTKFYCNPDCGRASRGEQAKGEKNYFWSGGDESYWKQQARERDNFTCQFPECEKRDSGAGTHAHHKIPRNAGGADTLDNLITLCGSHHGKIERRLLQALIERFPKATRKIAMKLFEQMKENANGR